MYYVCLDTNIYIGCALLSEEGQVPELLNDLKNIIEEQDVKLLVPEVIKSEFNGRIKDKREEMTEGLNNLKAEIGKADIKSNHDRKQLQNYIDELKEKRDRAMEEANEYLDKLFSSDNCITISLNKDIIVNTYLRQISNLRPFTKKDRDLPISVDCMIIESLKYFLEKNNSDNDLYFCTNDGDFYVDRKSSELHPDIKEKFPVEIKIFKNLLDLFEDFGVELSEEVKEQYNEIQEEMIRERQFYIPVDQFHQIGEQIGESMKNLGRLNIPVEQFHHIGKLNIPAEQFYYIGEAMRRAFQIQSNREYENYNNDKIADEEDEDGNDKNV